MMEAIMMKRFRYLRHKIETVRWQFFADNPAGRRILALADKLRNCYPENRLIETIWYWCLPF